MLEFEYEYQCERCLEYFKSKTEGEIVCDKCWDLYMDTEDQEELEDSVGFEPTYG